MATDQDAAQQSSQVERLRKEILSLRFDEIQQLVYNLPPRPPAKLVTVTVGRDPQDSKKKILKVKQEADKIMPNEQLAWTCPDGRLEVRFSRKLNPFGGDAYEVARGGKVFSGIPVKRNSKEQSYRYSLLVTTPDGYFLSKEVDIIVTATPKQTAKSKK
ncbi:MAG: hypothetical protein JST84_12190 [Acidobacteria bacterium]|nr:hypothetical protein [Acidobacteriota bacterium]